MIEGAGSNNSLARAAIEAALKSQGEAVAKVRAKVAETLGADIAAGAVDKPSFEGTLVDGLKAVNETVASVDRLPEEMLNGTITDFHELPGRLKQADLTFKFSLEVRNKLIDAYREVMRMSV